MLYNTENSYGWLAKLFHWVVGFGILTMLWVGYYMTDLPDSSDKLELYGMHKSFGVTVLFLVFLRALWNFKNTTPKLSEDTPHWQVIAADLNAKLLYFLMITMPSSGIFMTLYAGYPIKVFNLFTVPAFSKNQKLSSLAKEFHEAFAVLLILAISMHILAGLYHYFIKKDDVLQRMIK